MKVDLTKNWASDTSLAEGIAANLLSIFRNVRSQREEREEVWQESYRSWSVDRRDTDRSYKGRANIQVPQLRKEIETMSRRIYKGMFPEDYLKANPSDMIYEEFAQANTQLVRHYFDNVIRAKKPFMPWIKQGVTYGSSPLRSFWHKEQNEILYKKRKPKINKDGIVDYEVQAVKELVTMYDAPKLRAEDLFNVLIYPHNALTPEDIQIHFYRTKVKKSDLEKKEKEGTAVHLKNFIHDGKDMDWEFEESQERLQQFGDSGLYMAVGDDKYFDLLEIWCLLKLPDCEHPVSCVVEIVDETHVTRIQRNPYWHQMAPFDWMRFLIPPPGEFYGRGLPEAAISLQHQLNDTMNQTMDSNTLRLNNITVINPAYAPNADSFEVEPLAIWWADPQAVKQLEFPDLSDSGFKAAGILRGMISEMSDNMPQLPDPIAGKARSTGQAQLAVEEWQTDLFVFIDFMSMEGLSSLAYKTHLLIQQNISDDAIIRIAGKYSGTLIERVITADMVVGRYIFNWMGALQVENKSVKVQQLLNLLKVYPTLPPEAQSQIRVRWDNLMLKMFRDGFNIKDVENVMETDRTKNSCPPRIEEMILKKGGMIEVHPEDDDEFHLQQHSYYDSQDKDLGTRTERARHIQKHMEQREKKQQAAQMQQMMMQQMQGQEGPPRPQGNQAQLSESTNPADLERGLR